MTLCSWWDTRIQELTYPFKDHSVCSTWTALVLFPRSQWMTGCVLPWSFVVSTWTARILFPRSQWMTGCVQGPSEWPVVCSLGILWCPPGQHASCSQGPSEWPVVCSLGILWCPPGQHSSCSQGPSEWLVVCSLSGSRLGKVWVWRILLTWMEWNCYANANACHIHFCNCGCYNVQQLNQ